MRPSTSLAFVLAECVFHELVDGDFSVLVIVHRVKALCCTLLYFFFGRQRLSSFGLLYNPNSKLAHHYNHFSPFEGAVVVEVHRVEDLLDQSFCLG